ncbi:MAG: AI-2E family transporter [Chloroflexi bacterium]|nr:MAG: AI-2E family transporter [Chloroflexota bacterium]
MSHGKRDSENWEKLGTESGVFVVSILPETTLGRACGSRTYTAMMRSPCSASAFLSQVATPSENKPLQAKAHQEHNRRGMRSRWTPTTKRLVVGGLLLVGLLFLWRAGDIVQPFIWATILAYILLPVVGAIERRFALPRTVAAILVFVGVLAVIFGGGRVLVPRILDNSRDLQTTWPVLLANARTTVSDTFDQIGLGDLDDALIGPSVQDIEAQVRAMASRSALPFIVNTGHFLLEFLIFLIGTFLMLRDAPRLLAFVRRNVPRDHRAEVLHILGDTNVMLGRYIRGQLILVVLMSTVTTIGLTILGIPYSVLLGIMTGVLETIPFVGPITAGAIACLVALGHPNPFGWSQIAYVAVVAIMYTVLRHAEDYLVIPAVIGRAVRLHPAIVIFALLSGGAAFGLLGIVLAVPVAATLRLVLIYVRAKLRDEDPFGPLSEELATVTDSAGETATEAAGVRSGVRAHP